MKIVRIAARRPGFRRAGIAHPETPVDHPADRFNAKELAALKAEPALIVVELELPDAAEGEDTAKAKK